MIAAKIRVTPDASVAGSGSGAAAAAGSLPREGKLG
jgi:hypothetical protein